MFDYNVYIIKIIKSHSKNNFDIISAPCKNVLFVNGFQEIKSIKII